MLQVVDSTGATHPLLGSPMEHLFVFESMMRFSFNDAAVSVLHARNTVCALLNLYPVYQSWKQLLTEIERLELAIAQSASATSEAIASRILSLEDLLRHVTATVSDRLMNTVAANASFRSCEVHIYLFSKPPL